MNMNTLQPTQTVPAKKDLTIEELRACCPLPVLMHSMGLAKYAKASCPSPFRPDKKASWGIYQRDGRWFWKDHGTAESGDEIDFISRARKLKTAHAFGDAIDYWNGQADKKPPGISSLGPPLAETKQKPDASRYLPGSDHQLGRLAKLRDIDARGILSAHLAGQLVFGTFIGHEVFGVTDSSGNALEIRRLDGHPFPAHGALAERKSHAVKGSRKNWPVGIADIGDKPMVLMVEGLPDFLAAFEIVVREDALSRVAPVAMLSAGSSIAPDALPLFEGRHIRIVPHADSSGRAAGVRWKQQLLDAGASKVDFYSVTADTDKDTSPVKDLNDYLPRYRLETAAGSMEGMML